MEVGGRNLEWSLDVLFTQWMGNLNWTVLEMGIEADENQPFFVSVSNGWVNYFYRELRINEPQASQRTILDYKLAMYGRVTSIHI